ncbi:MAG: hypothetical protein ACXWNC_05550 [Anaerolineales bacterium]
MRVKLASLIFIFTVFLSACGLGSQGTPTAVPTKTPTPRPTFTPTPVLPLAVLILPSSIDKASSDQYQKVVYELAQKSGMHFQVRNTLTPASLPPGLKIVVALPPDPGIATLAAAAPQVQFLAVNIPGVTANGNISVLAGASSVDIPAFLAGYTAAMVTDDYHIGMVYPQDNPDALKALTAFTNGMVYYCGLCRPFYYLPYTFPQSIPIPKTEDPKNFGGYANYLITQRKVDTLYIYPDLVSQQFMDYIGTTGVQIIGISTPSPKPGGWVMTITSDEIKAIQNAWPNLVAGQGGANVQSPLGLSDIDPTILTPGKQRLVQLALDDLQAGRIATGVGP